MTWCFQVEFVFVQIREICAEFLPTSTFSHQEAGKIENQSRIAKISVIIDDDNNQNVKYAKCLIPEVCKIDKSDQVSSIMTVMDVFGNNMAPMPIILLKAIFNGNVCSTKIRLYIYFFRQYIIELLLKGLHRLEYRGYDRLLPIVMTY